MYDEAAGDAGSHRTSAAGASWPNSAAMRACAVPIASSTHMARRNSWPSGTVTLNPLIGSERLPAVTACSAYVALRASAILEWGASASKTMRRSTGESGSVGSSVSRLMPKNPVLSVAVQAPRGSDGSARLSRSVSVRLSSPTSYMQAETPGWPRTMPSLPRADSVPYTYDDMVGSGSAGEEEAPAAAEAPLAEDAAAAAAAATAARYAAAASSRYEFGAYGTFSASQADTSVPCGSAFARCVPRRSGAGSKSGEETGRRCACAISGAAPAAAAGSPAAPSSTVEKWTAAPLASSTAEAPMWCRSPPIPDKWTSTKLRGGAGASAILIAISSVRVTPAPPDGGSAFLA